MLRRIQFENIRCIEKIDLPLQRINILVGPNGSGKTTILETIRDVLSLPQRAIPLTNNCHQAAVALDAPPRSLIRQGATTWSVSCQIDEESFVLNRSQTPPTWHDGARYTIKAFDDFIDFFDRNENHILKLINIQKKLPQVRYLRLEASRIAADSHGAGSSGPKMEDDGYGVPTMLNSFLPPRGVRHPFKELLQSVIPAVRDVYWSPCDIDLYREEDVISKTGHSFKAKVPYPSTGFRLLFDTASASGLPASAMSEGTLLTLGLLTAVHQAGPSLLLLDDIDRALHPRAQVDLFRGLRELLGSRPDVQVVSTAHTPTLIAQCRREEVIRLEVDAETGKVSHRPVESPGAPISLMTIHEIMSDYFGVSQSTAGDLLQQYALYAGDPRRTEEEDRLLQKIRADLRALQLDPGWEPEPRAASRRPAGRKKL